MLKKRSSLAAHKKWTVCIQSTQIACSQTKEINNIKISMACSWFVVIIIIWWMFFFHRALCLLCWRPIRELVFFWREREKNGDVSTNKTNSTEMNESKTNSSNCIYQINIEIKCAMRFSKRWFREIRKDYILCSLAIFLLTLPPRSKGSCCFFTSRSLPSSFNTQPKKTFDKPERERIERENNKKSLYKSVHKHNCEYEFNNTIERPTTTTTASTTAAEKKTGEY